MAVQSQRRNCWYHYWCVLFILVVISFDSIFDNITGFKNSTSTTSTTTTKTNTKDDDNNILQNTTATIIICNQTKFDSSLLDYYHNEISLGSGSWVKGQKPYDSKFCCGGYKQHLNCTKNHARLGGHACLGIKGTFYDGYTWKRRSRSPSSTSTVSNNSSIMVTNSTGEKLLSFDKNKVCKMLVGSSSSSNNNNNNNNRIQVLMIGDSTMQQTFAVLKNSLLGGKCHQNLDYAFSDTLISIEGIQERGKSLQTILDNHFVKYPPKKQIQSIVILSVGPHIQDLCTYVHVMTTVFTDILPKYSSSSSTSTNNDPIFVWKTQNPAGCSFPIANKLYYPNNPAIAGQTLQRSQDQVWLTHNYHREFWYRDVLALAKIQEISMSQQQQQQKQQFSKLSKHFNYFQSKQQQQQLLKLSYLDMRMLYSRTDAHIRSMDGRVGQPPNDCLHYRSPGPLDIVAPLFEELLEQLLLI